jgi:colicin import membrane protein
MAREGVTLDQVTAAADALVADGEKPTLRAVRERLRGGSPNTIHRHLVRWRELRPRAAAPAPDLPNGVVRGILMAIEQAVAEARAELEGDLVQAQTVAGDLAATGEELEQERDHLLAQVASLTSERDTLVGRAAEQTSELERLDEELERERKRLAEEVDRERQSAERARIEVAQERLTSTGLRDLLAQQAPELERIRAQLTEEHEARIEAQRQQASLTAGHAALVERAAELGAREQAAQRAVAELRERVDQLLTDARTVASENARLTESAKRALEESDRLKADVIARTAAQERAAGESRSRIEQLENDRAALQDTLEKLRREAQADAVERARLEEREQGRRAPPKEAKPKP